MFALVVATMFAARAPAEQVAEAAARARAELPSVTWSATRALVADFTGDGAEDVALLGVDGRSVTVAVLVGPVTGGSRVLTLRFPADGGTQEGICGTPDSASIQIEQLGMLEEGCEPDDARCGPLAAQLAEASRRGAKGIGLLGGDCDAFHIVYDAGSLVWMRL